jgi:hypothetical protein
MGQPARQFAQKSDRQIVLKNMRFISRYYFQKVGFHDRMSYRGNLRKRGKPGCNIKTLRKDPQ